MKGGVLTMTYITHVTGGIVLGGIVYTIMPTGGPLSFFAGAVVGSLVPDLDHPQAFLNKRARISSPLTLFSHRGFTHSFLFAFLVVGILLAGGVWESVSMGLFWGILSHLLLDILNPSGVALLYPYQKRFSIARIRTSGAGEYGVLAALIGIIVLYFNIKK